MSSLISVITTALDCVGKSNVSGGAGKTSIKYAVGAAEPPRCRNLSDDVRAVQQALNKFSPLEGGPEEKLKVDGICGPKTNKAIYHFQVKWGIKPKGWKVPDGIVDPDGETIQRLNAGAGAINNLPAEFTARIPRVLEIVTAARASIMLAKNQLNSPTALFGKNDLERAERHFHIGKTRQPLQRLNEIDAIFLNMQTAIGYVPMGVILALDDPGSDANGYVMFAYSNGYSRRSKDEKTADGLHPGSVYLCPRARTLNSEAFAYVMIHELAHYVAPMGMHIGDHAYFAKDAQKYKSLDAERAYLNADCYAQFAFDAIGKRFFNTKSNTTS